MYTCPSAAVQVYLVAVGGDSGAGRNSGAVLMSALGACGTVDGHAFVVNEITTIASVYSLAQFMKVGSTAVGSSSTNSIGIANGFKTANNLYDRYSGRLRAKTPAGNGTVPQTKIDSLANLLATCVKSSGGSLACTKLFQATTISGVAPKDTLASILNIALNPAIRLNSLGLTGPYQPWLAGVPNDWTLSVEYTGGGLTYGQLIGADGDGNIWVPNATDPGTLSKFGPAGEALTASSGVTGGGLSYPQAVAVDEAGNVWTANEGNNTVSEHTPSGGVKSGTGFRASGLKLPYALALDASGNIFTANGDNSVSKLNARGGAAGQFSQGGLDFPYGIALDQSANIWVANYGYSNSASRFSNAGTAASTTGYSGGGIKGAVGIAMDAGGNAWIASFDQPIVSKLNPSGAALSGSGYRIPASAASIAVDGDNTVWTANSDGSVSRFTNQGAAISPSTGYVSNGATAGVGIAIDASGNVWTSDNYVNSLFEYIGAAGPTTIPLQVALKKNQVGKRP
jgi:streptogramin lyase